MKQFLKISIFASITLIFITIYQFVIFYDRKLHITFCDVGQGDAILIRTPDGLDILVDGGPDGKILDCLSSHMPFFDKTLELVILTHPHFDHFQGLFSVIKSYKISSFAAENLSNTAISYQEFVKLMQSKNIKTQYIYQNDLISLSDSLSIKIVGPSKEFLNRTSPNNLISDSSEFGSIESLITYHDFSILLTGDSESQELIDAINDTSLHYVSVLQVPHHGSKTGINETILQKIQPKLSVISVGANNRYHHPNPSIIDILTKQKIPIKRTDVNGDVEIVSDGKKFEVW